MPHKRRKNKATDKLDDSLADLAPNERLSSTGQSAKPRKRANNVKDDTPKDFLRLMHRVQHGCRADGLDDGNSERVSKKRKREENAAAKDKDANQGPPKKAVTKPSTETKDSHGLKIQPGESLRDFNRRVDAAMPHVRAKTGIPHKSHLKKLRKLEKAEAKRKAERGSRSPTPEHDPEADLSDDFDPEKDEVVPLPYSATLASEGKKVKKGARARSPDPWEELKKKREGIKFGEVVQAPPELIRVKELLRAPGARNVPKASGSLAKREALGGERERIIERYREMMQGKRGVETV